MTADVPSFDGQGPALAVTGLPEASSAFSRRRIPMLRQAAARTSPSRHDRPDP
jgi:hypothetical protein